MCVCVCVCACVWIAQLCPTLVTPRTGACQAPLSMEFSKQEYWSGLPFPSPGDLPDLAMEPRSPALQADSLPFELPGIYILGSPIRCWPPRERGCPLLHWLWGLYSDPGTQWTWWSTGRPSLENNSFVRVNPALTVSHGCRVLDITACHTACFSCESTLIVFKCSFRFSGSREGPESLHFWQAPIIYILNSKAIR